MNFKYLYPEMTFKEVQRHWRHDKWLYDMIWFDIVINNLHVTNDTYFLKSNRRRKSKHFNLNCITVIIVDTSGFTPP